MIPKLGLTRNVIRPHYALITPDGHVCSSLPGWTSATVNVLISATLGAGLVQYLITLEAKGLGLGDTGCDEWFVYVIRGKANVNKVALGAGGYAYLPVGTRYDIRSAAKDTRLLIFRKTYEALAGFPPPEFIAGHESGIKATPFLGDPHALLKTLLPDTPGADMAVNIFTYAPGATLPFVETHVMEHGMLFLSGSGVYRLGDDWHPVTAGDAIWIAPYCPQWFIAAGPEPARYIYYKDINRPPP